MADSAVKVLIGQERSRNPAHMDPGPDLSVWRPWAGEWWGAGVDFCLEQGADNSMIYI